MQVLLASMQTVQVVAMVVGLTVLLAWESIRPFFAFFVGQRKTRGLHLVRNIVLGGVNSLVVALLFVGLWLAAAIWAEQNKIGLMNWLLEAGTPRWVHTVGAILLFDAWTYIWHRLNHRVPFLWRFHRVHHADSQMDVTTAGRFHLGEIVLSSALRIPLIILIGAYAWELVLYETMMFAVVQFHHANVGLPSAIDRVLRTIFVTPNMHKVHHSRIRVETDSNYSAFLSIWDRIGRTFRLRARPHEIDFGLDEFDDAEDATLAGMMKMPLANPER